MGKKQISELNKVNVGIFKNMKNKKWKCIIDTCEYESINSHLLQKNGILNLVSENNHVIEVKTKDFFKLNEENSPLTFKKVSVNNALSLKLFCSKHDNSIFKFVEKLPLDLNNYKTHLLFTYRVICAEIRKKEYNIETFKRLLNSYDKHNSDSSEIYFLLIEGSKRGISDLMIYKQTVENELNGSESGFVFNVLQYPLIKVYCSAGFNIYETYETPLNEIPLKYVFIHIIPSNDCLNVIIGYHKLHFKKSIVDYCNSWRNLTNNELELKLTDLFATRIENWGFSPLIYKNIDKSLENAFINHFSETYLNYLDGKKVNFNFFENKNYGI